ncbi:MAG: hydrogenase iron-sulfur subunit [Methanomassiliicoccales archaeon]|nr:hydrogenase iron-sulfur subunit [Methanomassiliicoccales archaeon]
MSQTKRIVAYCCEHGGIGAAERAKEEGGYSPEVQIIPVPCIGRVDVLHMLQAFREGADAVFLAGCLEKNCHHLYGNLEAGKKVDQARRILDSLGIEGERLELFNVASNQGREFKESVDIMIERVERLGPNRLGVQR